MDATAVDPLVGRLLDGRYRIESKIARGGMATVYVGRDTKLDRVIALKVMHPHLAQDDDFVRRFIGEAKAAAALSHPNVVAVYDQGADGANVFLAMEYLPGKTLRDLLDERGRLSSREAVEIMLPVLSALGAAHRAGLIHRDVKPENVLLTTDGQIKVADFGLARAESDSKQTKTGVMIGTVAYMAPEQVINGQADARSDVYAAGILLFELITGRQPHRADTPLSVAYKHVNEQVPLPSSLVPGVPQRIDALIASATNRDPARRPTDANHFYSLISDASLALPAPGPTPPPSPDNATSILSVPAPTLPSNGHTSVFQGPPVFPPEEPVPTFDRIMYFVTGRFVLIALGLIAAMVIGWATWYQVSGQYNHVPHIVGLDLDAAEAKLSAEGIKFTSGKKEFFDTVKAGQVGRVDPGQGTKIKPGQTVTVFVSKGRLPRTVPPVKGSTQDDARTTLQNAGFTNVAAAVTYQASADVEKDKVVATDPAESEKVSPDDPITLIVSKGIVMPDVTGKAKDDATTILGKLGLNINVNEDQRDDSKPAGTVLNQDPAKDIPVKAGDTVTIFINKADCLIGNFFCDDGDNSKDDQGNKRVPRLAGKSVDEAVQILTQHGFQPNVQHQFNSGKVFREQPNGGEKAPEGSVVTIWD